MSASTKQDEKFHRARSFCWGTTRADVAASFFVASITSTGISIIDKSIMQRTLGITDSVSFGLKDGIKTLITQPHRFFIPCGNKYAEVYYLVFMTYSLTYLAGNLTQTYLESQGKNYDFAKFVSGSTANVVFTLVKDNQMLKLLPPPKAGQSLPVPNFCRVLFFCRDCLTVLASFYVAPWVRDQLGPVCPDWDYKFRSDVADLTIPALLQFVSTPMHLYGIALKENPKESQRFLFDIVRRDYFPAVFSRMGRIIPAFGFGMMAQKRIRSRMQEDFEGPEPTTSSGSQK